jgi:hypothetical protein
MTATLSVAALSAQLTSLQNTARAYCQLPASQSTDCRLRPFYVTGTALAWRLLETQVRQTANGAVQLRRMHSFDTMEKLRACLIERVAWKRADTTLVSRYQSGLEPTFLNKDDTLEAVRERLRLRFCRTQPNRTKVLENFA